jgi:hypothetical protein
MNSSGSVFGLLEEILSSRIEFQTDVKEVDLL